MEFQCLFCQIRSFGKLLQEQHVGDEQKKVLARDFLGWLSEIDLEDESPEYTRTIHEKIRNVLGTTDPYKEIKKKCNDYMLKLYPQLKKMVAESSDPFTTSLKLAIAGNIIDYAASPEFSIDETIGFVMESDFSIDHSQLLKEQIEKANTILYLGDNAGEIVMDRLFLETLNHPGIYFAVRGEPIINDVTLDDALYIGVNKLANVISNGHGAPSTLVERCSPEFQELFKKADLIISKGQGNLEGLLGNKNQSVFYLLMVKCDLIGERLGVNKGDFVVCHNKLI